MARKALKDPPLRVPGQSLDEQRRNLFDDELSVPFWCTVILVGLAGLEWWRHFVPQNPQPLVYSGLAVAALGYFLYKFFRTRSRIRRLKLARDGERVVGQYLEQLRGQGYQVFHDVIGDGFNVDHVLIGPTGVYTVETKTYSKPDSGRAEVVFDGEQIAIGHWQPDRNPVVQARAQAGWLRELLRESTGKDYEILPVVLFPGWFVRQQGRPARPIWVLNPKALPEFLKHREPGLAESDINLAAYHLSRSIRAQQRLGQAD